ncbi:MAG: hypothetical protein KDA61_21835 [Planctomycetales bacterium]|nr:hypothetical protein [Planctomycetales bacterium]
MRPTILHPVLIRSFGVAWLLATTTFGVRVEADERPEPIYFGVRVVDAETGRGVPLVELRSVNQVSHWTDSDGWVAIDEPAWNGRHAFFNIASHGYETPADGFGQRGVRLLVAPGTEQTITLRRVNLGERLYRITGEGIYRDSVLLGKRSADRNALLNGRVVGSDSTQCVEYRDKLHWFWGDTFNLSYALGNFHVPGAVSTPPRLGGPSPSEGLDLEYYVDDEGFARPTCVMPGPGPTWISGLCVVGEGEQARMFATYVKIRDGLSPYERGLAVFDDATNRFVRYAKLPLEQPFYPWGHPIDVATKSSRYIYFCLPFPWLRTQAEPAALGDPQRYESYTYAVPTDDASQWQVLRDEAGRLDWKWRRAVPPLTRAIEEKLVDAGQLAASETSLRLRVLDGAPVLLHASSIAWSPYRNKWIMIVCEEMGTSYLGEIWYAESDALEGPWENARKVVSHERYSFYNLKLHAVLAEEGGRFVYFEGTYTREFSGNPIATPRYDYNQIMYRLDLSRLLPTESP